MAQVRFDTAKFKGCGLMDGTPIKSFTLRETGGPDEEYAAQRAKAKGGTSNTTEEMIRASIVEVNGTPVPPDRPYEGLDQWNSRARSFLLIAWRKVNQVSDAEEKDFLAAAVDA